MMLGWGVLIGLVVGFVIAAESLTSRIMSYFMQQGFSEEDAHKLLVDLLKQKYKWYK